MKGIGLKIKILIVSYKMNQAIVKIITQEFYTTNRQYSLTKGHAYCTSPVRYSNAQYWLLHLTAALPSFNIFQKLFFVCQIICVYFFVCLTCYCVRNCLVLKLFASFFAIASFLLCLQLVWLTMPISYVVMCVCVCKWRGNNSKEISAVLGDFQQSIHSTMAGL